MTKARAIPTLLLLTALAWWIAYVVGDHTWPEALAAMGFTLAWFFSTLREDN